MGRDWKRLGAAFRQAREARGLKQVQLAEATDQNLSTIQNLESARYGRGFNRVPSSAHRVARFLGWTEGSIAVVLDGGEPKVESDPLAALPASLLNDVRARAIWELPLPLEERIQGIRDLFEADLQRAREAEERKQAETRRTG